MKKIWIVILCMAAVAIAGCCVLWGSPPAEDESVQGGLKWLEEESVYLGAAVDGERVTVRFELAFRNDGEMAAGIAPPSARFSRRALQGWMKYDDLVGYFVPGAREDGVYQTVVQPGETVRAVFLFTGEYLGGELPEILERPEEIMLLTSFL